jgi:hypothetical protein
VIMAHCPQRVVAEGCGLKARGQRAVGSAVH